MKHTCLHNSIYPCHVILDGGLDSFYLFYSVLMIERFGSQECHKVFLLLIEWVVVYFLLDDLIRPVQVQAKYCLGPILLFICNFVHSSEACKFTSNLNLLIIKHFLVKTQKAASLDIKTSRCFHKWSASSQACASCCFYCACLKNH